MNFSIVIPTYNGSGKIQHCIRGLKNLIIPNNSNYEIIFIDNCSTDNVVDIINQSNLNNYKIEKEFKQGSFFARDKGIKESKYNWIFCIDDDIEVQPNWIIEFFKIIESNPNAGLIAAPLKFPEEYNDLPTYIKTFKTIFAITEDTIDQGLKHNMLSSMFCVNKEAYLFLENNGFKHNLIGRDVINNSLIGGEDIEYSLTLKYTPFKNYITKSTFGYHYLDKNRLNYDYCVKLQKSNGVVMSKLAPLMFMDKEYFKKHSSYYYYLLRSFLSLFKIFKTKEEFILHKVDKISLILNLLKCKKEYQTFENDIKNAKWNKSKGEL